MLIGSKFCSHGGKHLIDAEILHALVVPQRANALLTGRAGEVELQMLGTRVMVLTPGDVRGSENRDRRNIERRGKVTRPTVGRYEQATATNAGLAESEAERFFGQAFHTIVIRARRDLMSQRSFAWSAKHQHCALQLAGDAPRRAMKCSAGHNFAAPNAPLLLIATTSPAGGKSSRRQT